MTAYMTPTSNSTILYLQKVNQCYNIQLFSLHWNLAWLNSSKNEVVVRTILNAQSNFFQNKPTSFLLEERHSDIYF